MAARLFANGGFNLYQTKVWYFTPEYQPDRRPNEWQSFIKLMGTIPYYKAIEALVYGKITVRLSTTGNRPCGIKEELIIPQPIRIEAYQLIESKYHPAQSNSEKEAAKKAIESPLAIGKPILKAS